MTKAEIVQTLYKRVGALLEARERRDRGRRVRADEGDSRPRGARQDHGFGKLALRDKRERPGRNPQTGEAITIEERRVRTFKASPSLREVMNLGAGGDVASPESAADERPSAKHGGR